MPPESVQSFAAYPQPEWNTPSSVNAALAQLNQSASEAEAWTAYHALLYAVGNNHAGTYYSVVLAVVPTLELELRFGAPWAQYAAVQALLDLTGSFEPEPGHELFSTSPEVAPTELRKQLRAQVRTLIPALRQLAIHERPAAFGARGLLELIENET